MPAIVGYLNHWATAAPGIVMGKNGSGLIYGHSRTVGIPKCRGGPQVDRDRLNAYPRSRASHLPPTS
ncbi:hypothetical protein TNCV_2837421 [Trichonephila clavipes]|nr:hypothetical protein TNCV_2837421 [Trichonephila clavipes]